MSDDVLRAATPWRISIGELTALGGELDEGHLRLAAGGTRRKFAVSWDCTYYAGDSCGDRLAFASVTP